MKVNFLALIAIAGLTTLPACSKADTAKAAPLTTTQTQSLQTQSLQTQSMKVTHVNAVQASQLMAERPTLVVLDVRTPGEFARGHIDGAVNIDFRNADFASNLTQLDMGQDYLIHCRSGGRSTKSLAVFKRAGFSHIIHMDGGMNGWNKAKLPTIK